MLARVDRPSGRRSAPRYRVGARTPLPPRPRRVPRARGGARLGRSPSHPRVATSRRPRPRPERHPARRAGSRARDDGRRRGPGVRDRSLEEEVGVAAREEPRGSRGPRSGAERRLVAGEDPRVADRCSHRGQRPAERVERRDASSRGDPRPLSERLGRGGAEDVQVPARELEASLARVDLGWRHGPDGGLSRAVPPDHDRAGRCGVPEPVGVLAERSPASP